MISETPPTLTPSSREAVAQPSPHLPAHPPCIDGGQEHGNWTALYGGVLRRCDRCTLVATDRVPTFDYDGEYFVGTDSGGYDFDAPYAQAQDRARFTDEMDRLEASGVHGSVLDVGSATGTFLHYAQKRGWEIAGVEVAEYARQRVSGELGVPIAGSLAELPAGQKYDLVTLHHVLEHIHEPLAFLRDEVAPRVGRRLLIEVPNFAALASRTHGPRWRDLRPEQHVYHYTPETLSRLVAATGLKVRRTYTLGQALWSVTTAIETLRLLPALMRKRTQDGVPFEPGAAVAVDDVADFRLPTGVKKLAADAAGIAMYPFLRLIDARGRGPRLVVEAEAS